jgi:hypothetical protein
MTNQTLHSPFQTALQAAQQGRRPRGYDCLVAAADAWQGLLSALREDGRDVDYTTDDQQYFAGLPSHVTYCERELQLVVERLVSRGLRVLIVRGEED